MAYVAPIGSAVGLDLQGAALPPPAGSVNLEFDPTYTADIRAVGGISVPFSQVGFIVRNQRSNLFLAGVPPPAFPYNLSIEIASLKVRPDGIPAPTMASQNLVYRQVALPRGIPAPENSYQIARIRAKGGYNAPPASSVILDFLTTPYTAPPATSVILDFGSVGYSRVLGASLGDQSRIGLSTLTKSAGITGTTLGNQSAIGLAVIQNSGRTIFAQGIASPAFPNNHIVIRKFVQLFPSGIPAASFPSNHSLRKRLSILNPSGIAPIAITVIHRVLNFRQVVSPVGIAPPAFPVNHSVSYNGSDWDIFNYSLMLF